MEGDSFEPRYVLRPVPLAHRVRNAVIVAVTCGGAAALIGSYLLAHNLLSKDWIYPAAVAVFGVVCAALALMERAWPEQTAAGRKEEERAALARQEPGKDEKGGTLGSPTQS